jgi:hypothetical protein
MRAGVRVDGTSRKLTHHHPLLRATPGDSLG